MGIIVNFTAGTVQGFPITGHLGKTEKEEVTVPFNGREVAEGIGLWLNLDGTIDRVTDDISAFFLTGFLHTGTTGSGWEKTHRDMQTVYSLKCEPTQRMF